MSRKILLGLVLVTAFCRASNATLIDYTVNDLGGNSFEFVYTVVNDTLQIPIEQFTIWFDEALYDNLQITTQSPLADAWDEIILGSPGFGIPIGYDALTLNTGIAAGDSTAGFTVTATWLGQGQPENQSFEIIDPDTSQTIDSGQTIPEPVTMLLLTCGLIGLRVRNKKNS